MQSIISTNELPELPRKIKKTEAKVTPRVMEWIQKNYPFSVAVEIKVTKGNSIPRSAVKPHQLKALLAVKDKAGLSYKIPDTGKTRLPFDAFVMKKTPAYVVACFIKNNKCLAIPPEKWEGAKPNTNCTFSIPL